MVLQKRQAARPQIPVFESAEYQIRVLGTRKFMDVKTDETLVRRSEITIETMTVTRIRRVSGNAANGVWTPEIVVITDYTPEAIVPEPVEDERS